MIGNIKQGTRTKDLRFFGFGKGIAFLIAFLLCSNLFYAQNNLTTSNVLASAKNEYHFQLEKKRIDFLKKNNLKLPVMDELEFRTETNDFNLREQEYALRGRFFTKEQREAQANFNQANIELQSLEQRILMNELLRDRYLGIVEVFYFEKLLIAKKEEKILLEDRLTVLKKSINLPRFEILDVIEAEDNLHDAERDILRLENALDFSQQKIFRWTNQSGFLRTQDVELLDVEKVMDLIRSFPIEPSATHTALVKRNLNANLAIQEQAIRRTKEENTVDFFQAKIGGTDDNGFRQNFTLGMGLRIPIRNREEIQLNELEFEKLDELARAEEIRLELTSRMLEIRLEMENQYRLYELLKKQMESSQAESVLQQYQKIAGTSPLALLKLKGNKFKKELEQFRVEQDIYLLYIELLDASGKMMEMPMRNYMEEGLPTY